MKKIFTIQINNQAIQVEKGETILQACDKLKIEIPRFCYHPLLSVAGNCRMCLVEVEGIQRPVASCSMPVMEGMIVKTRSPFVQKARKGVLELLLINHPLDCPICDQGGECDLQDLTYHYGPGKTRFNFNKRAVPEKYLGPLIKTAMTRCIHCTRCARFSNEISGTEEMIAIGRGENTEITSYLESAITSELSGNMIDICPVGALTAKPYAFHGRSWEFDKTNCIDVMDGVGSHIEVHSRGGEVMRILPRSCPEINEEWIDDKARFAFDGLKYQRLDKPYYREEGHSYTACTWEEAFTKIKENFLSVKPCEAGILVGDLIDCETLFLFKKLLKKFNVTHLDCRPFGSLIPHEHRYHYLFNSTIEGIEKIDVLLLIGTNPRVEAPLVQARVRKRFLKEGLTLGLIGPHCDLTVPYQWLGDSVSIFDELKNHPFMDVLLKAENPAIIIGESVFSRPDISSLLKKIQSFLDVFPPHKPCEYNVLHTAASRVGGLDLGFLPQQGGFSTKDILKGCQEGRIKFLYLLGRDDIEPALIPSSVFVVYQGHHGDKGASRANVILPGAAYTEKEGTYVNIEGRPQRSFKAISPPGEALEDWKIIRELSSYLGENLRVSTLKEVQENMAKNHEIFKNLGCIEKAERLPLPTIKEAGEIQKDPIQFSISNYYMSNVIAKHSKTMALCAREILGKSSK